MHLALSAATCPPPPPMAPLPMPSWLCLHIPHPSLLCGIAHCTGATPAPCLCPSTPMRLANRRGPLTVAVLLASTCQTPFSANATPPPSANHAHLPRLHAPTSCWSTRTVNPCVLFWLGSGLTHVSGWLVVGEKWRGKGLVLLPQWTQARRSPSFPLPSHLGSEPCHSTFPTTSSVVRNALVAVRGQSAACARSGV